VASVEWGDIDLLRDPLEFTPVSRLPPIEVQLRNDGASLSVSVASNGAAASGWILLVSSQRPREAKVSFVEANHQGILENLAPGDYAVIALDRIDGLEYTNPDVLSESMARSVHVTLEPEQQRSLKLELTHTAR
jgi:hypothetical protein